MMVNGWIFIQILKNVEVIGNDSKRGIVTKIAIKVLKKCVQWLEF